MIAVILFMKLVGAIYSGSTIWKAGSEVLHLGRKLKRQRKAPLTLARRTLLRLHGRRG